MTQLLRERFGRTVCDCRECRVGCWTMPGPLTPSDVPQLLRQPESGETTKFVLSHFQAGCCQVSFAGHVLTVPTIVPKLQRGGCVFYRDGLCKIHDKAPFGCSHFDEHMSQGESDERRRAYVVELLADAARGGEYSRWARCLIECGALAPPLETRRANYELAVAALRITEGCVPRRDPAGLQSDGVVEPKT